MPEYSDDGSLLQALRDEPIPPSTLDAGELLAKGRRRVRTRNWIGAATVTAVLIAAIPLVLTKARSPNVAPDQLPLATPTQMAIAPTTCTAEVLPVPQGYDVSLIVGGDPSGRYLAGFATRQTESVPVVWANGVILPVSLPPNTHQVIVNEHGVIAGYSPDVAWVYRDGKFTNLAQPSAAVSYRPVAINSKGQIAGAGPIVVKGQTGYPPVIWGPDGGIESVADRSFMVRDIDDDGTVIGQENLREFPGDLHGLIWRAGAKVADLPTPPGVERAGAMSIRDGWVGGVIAYLKPTDGPLKPIIFQVGTKESAAVPPEVEAIEDVNAHGWAAVRMTGGGSGLLAGGKVLRLLPAPGAGAPEAVTVHSISDDGRVIGGLVSNQGGVRTRAVRWTCQ